MKYIVKMDKERTTGYCIICRKVCNVYTKKHNA